MNLKNKSIDELIEEIYMQIILPSILELESLNEDSSYFYELKKELFEGNKNILEFNYLNDINSENESFYYLFVFLNKFIYKYDVFFNVSIDLMKKNSKRAKIILNKYYSKDYVYQDDNVFRYLKIF